MKQKAFNLFLCSIVSVLAGCEPRQKQFEVEARTVFGLIKMLESYELEHPGVPITNLSQVFSGLEREYPHNWHKQLNAFGKFAGFTNSFYERYVFFPSGVTNSRIGGELVCMNAIPYPAPYNEMNRSLVAKAANRYFRVPLREEQIQHLLKEANIPEPKPVPMPAPPAPPATEPMAFSTKVSRFFMRLAGYLGISEHWLLLRNATFLVVVVGIFALGGYLLFSRVRRR